MFTAFKLIAQLVNVLVTVDALNFVVLDEATQEEATLDKLDIFLDDDLFPEFGGEEADVPALEVAEDQVKN